MATTFKRHALVSIAEADQKSFFQRNPHLAVYGHRRLLIALCQGGALHDLDCKKDAKKKNGVKDLDVYSFYADDPEIPWPYRRHGVADFGESEFGYHPNKRQQFVGRHVDLMGRALPVAPGANPGLAVRDWLATSNNQTPRLLRKKAVVGLHPAKYFGKIIWDPDADLQQAQRAQRRSNGGSATSPSVVGPGVVCSVGADVYVGADVVHRRVQHLVGGRVADPEVGGDVGNDVTGGDATVKHVAGTPPHLQQCRVVAGVTAANAVDVGGFGAAWWWWRRAVVGHAVKGVLAGAAVAGVAWAWAG